jgi:hypothetical protein
MHFANELEMPEFHMSKIRDGKENKKGRKNKREIPSITLEIL